MRESKLLIAAVLLILLGALPAVAQTGRVAGLVRDDRGQPVKGATVTAENPGASPPSFTATSDERGRFSIIGLRAGNWKFTAAAPGFTPSVGQLNVRTIGAANPPLEFTLAAAAPTGPASGGALAGINTQELQAELQAAEDLMNAANYDGSITAYQAILDKTPALTMINMQIGRAHRMKKDYDAALRAYNAILEVEPTNERAKIEVGMTNLEKGDLDAADAALTEAAQSLGASREVFYNLGEVKFVKGDTDEAMKYYQRAIDTDPRWAKPIFKLGLSRLQKADTAGALEMMEKVIAVEPTSEEAGLARALIEQLKQG